ncbi:hypothetical protein [Tenacibaculum ovolyticum]|uniref:hypothetical protein n=1 Tax=Tenacibaculum ovolyticum TaxID=104270 RepID=UPI00040C1447|nr:hypothetical protein [Tenacibaculum ovolyticum]
MVLLTMFQESQSNTNLWTSIFGGAIGAGIISLIAIVLNRYYDKIKYNKEVKTFLWKEKIEAAKKASEFYLEFLNYINLLITHFELLSDDEIGSSELANRISLYENKFIINTNYAHHHINIFEDLLNDDTKIFTLRINKAFHKIKLSKKEERKLNQKEIIILIDELKLCYSQLEIIQKEQLSKVRNSIKNYLN